MPSDIPDAVFAHVDRDLPEGSVVGEYAIEKKLGEGGFGAVYRAIHPLIGKHAAVKILAREFSANPQMVSRFVAEARAVNQIRHRNIIDIFSFGQLKDGRQYYIMELLDGMTFDQYLAKHGRLSLEDALPILRGVSRALDAAHAKGILHRDLKPENIFLSIDEDGRIEPKLLDFGLVKLMSKDESSTASGSGEKHKTKTGTPMGTPYYMSPEQSRGQDVDARTDVYSFGAMVFETLTGTTPFDGSSALDILVQHMNAPIPKVSERGALTAFDEPVARMLAKSASDRPATVGEALSSLQAAAGMPADSVRSIKAEPAASQEIATARTMMAGTTPATFLGTSSDVVPTAGARKGKTGLFVIAGAGALLLVAVAIAALHRSPEPPAQGVVASAPPSAVISAAPAATTVAIRTEGVPDTTAVVADGGPITGTLPPSKVPKEKPAAPTAHRPAIHKDLDSFDNPK